MPEIVTQQKCRISLCTYSICHALVDFICAFAIIGSISLHGGSSLAVAGLILLYNFCAFVLQPFVGFFADYLRRTGRIAAAGCILVGIGTFISVSPLLTAALMGIGNAFFHVGGGTSVIRAATHKATAAGIFIAPGAIGISAGTILPHLLFSRFKIFLPFSCLAVMALCAVAIIFFDYAVDNNTSSNPVKVPKGVFFCAVIFLLLACVFTRSYVGFATPMPWKTTAVLVILAASAAAAGKALGGILGDKFGYIPVVITGLALSAVLLPFFNKYIILSLAGLVLFNLTMPLVLAALTDVFPGHMGFAFGLNSALLFPGLLFAGTPGHPIIISVMTAACAVILVLCFRTVYNKKMKEGSSHVKISSARCHR